MGKKLTSIIICLSIFVLQCVNVFATDIETESIDLDTLNDIIEAESIEKMFLKTVLSKTSGTLQLITAVSLLTKVVTLL